MGAEELPPHNLAAERATLGAVLLVGRAALEDLTLELGLRAEHFYRPAHAELFAALCALADRGDAVDPLTAVALLRERGTLALVGAAEVEVISTSAPAAGNFRDYAAIVVREANWRARQAAVREAQAAITRRDEDAFATAQGQMTPGSGQQQLATPQRQIDGLFRWWGAKEPDTIPLPFNGLNRLLGDGLRRGDSTVIASWTSWGKSVLTAQILRHAASRGFRVCCYSNEMSDHTYALRSVAALSGVPFYKISRKSEHRTLTRAENERILRAFSEISVPIQNVAGWSGVEIARHVRRSRWDLWALDYIHKVPYDGVRELDQITATLTSVAVETDSHGLIVAQLNQERNKGAELPRPVRRDLRGSGALQNDPANILMIARDQEEVHHQGRATGIWRPLPPSTIYLEKQRNGALGGIAAWMDENRMMFTEEAA